MVKLATLLENIERTPVSVAFLKKRVPDNVSVVSYESLKGKHRSEVFKQKRAVIVLIPKKGSPKGHFIALIPRKHHIEYFSSLGNSFESELSKLEAPLGVFRSLLGKRFIYNRIAMQSGMYNINTCGAFVLARVLLADLKLREFQMLFRRITLNNPDDIVAMMVLLSFVNT